MTRHNWQEVPLESIVDELRRIAQTDASLLVKESGANPALVAIDGPSIWAAAEGSFCWMVCFQRCPDCGAIDLCDQGEDYGWSNAADWYNCPNA